MFATRWHLNFARVLMALAVVWTGLQMVENGGATYSPLLHAWRRMLVPELKNRISDNWTWEMVNTQIIKAMGCLMIAGGLLILVNLKKAGGAAVVVVLSFLILTQDNPLIKGFIRPKPKDNCKMMNDFTRHLSLLGVCLFMMFHSPEL